MEVVEQEPSDPDSEKKVKLIDAVLHTTEHWRTSENHVELLKQRGGNAVLFPCSDISTLESMTMDDLSSLHLIVDTGLYRILMDQEDLCDVAKRKLKELDKSRKRIHVLNTLPMEFEELFIKLPRNARTLWDEENPTGAYGEDSTHKQTDGNLPKRETFGQGDFQVKGPSGSTMGTANVAGTIDGGMGNTNNESSIVVHTAKNYQIINQGIGDEGTQSITVEEGSQERHNCLTFTFKNTKQQDQKIHERLTNEKETLKSNDIRGIEVNCGSVIIKLYVDKSRIMTDEWIHEILQKIFHDILKDFFTEETVQVMCERHISMDMEHFLEIYSSHHSLKECFAKVKKLKNDDKISTDDSGVAWPGESITTNTLQSSKDLLCVINDDKEDGASGGRTKDSRPNPPKNASVDAITKKIKTTHVEDNEAGIAKKSRNEIDKDVYYCCHCGNVVVKGPNIFCTDCESLKTTLDDVTNKFSQVARYKNLMRLGIHVDYLYSHDSENRKKGEKRTLKRQELLKKVSALLNTGSGHILIHLVALHKDEHYQVDFDEFADDYLTFLINDGRLFADVYEKKKLSEFRGFSNYSDVLVLTVEVSEKLLTSDFKTKCVTDVNIKDINAQNLERILRVKKTFKTDHHQFDFETLKETPDPSLHESREVQLKAISLPGVGDEMLVEHILGHLKLPLYVSAFSKNSNGGSYVAGVGEGKTKKLKKENKCYESATVIDPEQLPTLLGSELKKKCLVCDYAGNVKDVDDLVTTTLVPHMKDGQHYRNKFIIVVSVRPVQGLVFHDPEGPVAYVISEKNPDSKLDSIECLPFKKWFERMKPN